MAKEPVSRPSGGGGGKSAPSRSAPSRSKADMRDDRPSGGRSITPVAKPISGGGVRDVRARQPVTAPSGSGAGGIASIAPQFVAGLGGTKGSGAGYAPQVRGAIPFPVGVPAGTKDTGTLSAFPTGPARMNYLPFSMGVAESLAPVVSPPPLQRPAGLDPETSLADRAALQAQEWYRTDPSFRMTGQVGGLGDLPLGSEIFESAGDMATIGVGFPRLPSQTSGRYLGAGVDLTMPPLSGPSSLPSIGPTAPTPMMTPGRMMPSAGAMEARAALGQYSPSLSPTPVRANLAPTTSPRPVMAPAFQTEGLGQTSPDGTNYASGTTSLAPEASIRPLPRLRPAQVPTTDLGGSQTVAPVMSPGAVAADIPTTPSGGVAPVVVPGSLTSPGLGLLAGAQNLLSGGFRDAMSGLFSGEFRDTRSPEQRASDWFASQREMDRGSDRVLAAPVMEDVVEDATAMPEEKPAWWPDYLPWPPQQQPTAMPTPAPTLPMAPSRRYSTSYAPMQSAIRAGIAGMPMRFG